MLRYPCAGWGQLSAVSVLSQVPCSAQGGRKVRVSWRSIRLLAALSYPLLFTHAGNNFVGGSCTARRGVSGSVPAVILGYQELQREV